MSGTVFKATLQTQWRHCAIASPNGLVLLLTISCAGVLGLEGTCAGSTAISVRVSSGTDDAEELSSTGTMHVSDAVLDMPVNGSTTNMVGIRFNSVAIPKGATVTYAYIQFKGSGTSSGAASLLFRGQAADNASSFTTSNGNISSRATTTASVSWSPSNWNPSGEAGVNQRTPNLSAIVQEIVSRPGWALNNSLVLIITGSGARRAVSFEGDSSASPLLYVEYTCNGTVGHWKLNHASGTGVTDSSVFAANGTVNGTLNWSTRCGDTRVFDFNGTTNYISIPDAPQLRPFNSLTIAAWIRGDSWGSGTDNDNILRKGEANPNNFALAISNSKVELILDGFDASGFRGNTVLSTGQWYHVAATWDGSSVRIYVNGVLDNTPATRTGSIGTDNQSLYIGGRPGADLFDGMIHDVRLYNRALSHVEIRQIAQVTGHWTFSEGTGTTAADSSAGANNATLSGGATWTTDCVGNNNALLTNGAGGIARTAADFTPPDDGTVAFWMRSNGNPPARQRVFGLGGDWEVRQETDGTLSFDLCGEAGTDFVTTQPLNEAGRWYHVAATFDATNRAYAVYVDGQLHKAGFNGNAMTQQPANLLSFGTRTGSTEYWQGALRDVRVYSRRLCPVEIAELYGLVGHWKLDEMSGTVAADASGMEYHGSVIGTANWTRGKVDQGLRLDGATRVEVNSLMGSPRNVTLAGWANLSAADSGGAELVSIGDYFAIRLNAGSTTRAFFYSGTSWSAVSTNQTYAGRGWHHFAAVFNDDRNYCKLYIDGAEAASVSTNVTIPYSGLNSKTFIGCHGNGQTTYDFTGKVDDIRVYNRALCPAEIQTLYGTGSAFEGVRIIKWVEIQ